MAQINISNLTFYYEGSYDNVFEDVSFQIDTNWKLGFIGRNGKGKTTFLNLLLGKYEYKGSISSSVLFDYFPYKVKEEQMEENTIDVIEYIYPDYELWKICMELNLLETDADILYRPYNTLSHGERTKIMLAVLFSKDNYFLLIDEPTNHLDMATREIVRDYLNMKKGFILVSHDRWLLDSCIDHILVLNRNNIQVEKGNFSSWWENKTRQDSFERAENDKLKKEIGKLTESARRTSMWADKSEASKIGYGSDPKIEKNIGRRAYIGEKTRKMEQRRKNLEQRQEKSIEQKSELLKNTEKEIDLKIMPLNHHKEVLVRAKELSISYDENKIINNIDFELKRGEIMVLQGKNGSGKSSILKAVLNNPNVELLSDNNEVKEIPNMKVNGMLEVVSGLKVSYINQDTSHLKGRLSDYIKSKDVDESLFKSILRQLDFERTQFDKNMEEYSEGQKKKVLIAGSLMMSAHLYIWDEPLNYIDVFSRLQIERLIQKFKPTMMLVEHDKTFIDQIEAEIISLD